MNILGTIIRTDEIIGIGQLQWQEHGEDGYYCFDVLTRSSSVEIRSILVRSFKHATADEQKELAAFKQHYAIIRTDIAMMMGDAATIYQVMHREEKVKELFEKLGRHTDVVGKMISQSKLKYKGEILAELGLAWAVAKDMKDVSIN